jgi:hypothetical protein
MVDEDNMSLASLFGRVNLIDELIHLLAVFPGFSYFL